MAGAQPARISTSPLAPPFTGTFFEFVVTSPPFRAGAVKNQVSRSGSYQVSFNPSCCDLPSGSDRIAEPGQAVSLTLDFHQVGFPSARIYFHFSFFRFNLFPPDSFPNQEIEIYFSIFFLTSL
jgi:hypothetical protein